MNNIPDLSGWTAFAAERCGTPPDVPTEAILALSKVVAHQVARPAVPVTAYLAGYLAGAQQASAAEAIERLHAAAEQWEG